VFINHAVLIICDHDCNILHAVPLSTVALKVREFGLVFSNLAILIT
jgi:hypothetical protein